LPVGAVRGYGQFVNRPEVTPPPAASQQATDGVPGLYRFGNGRWHERVADIVDLGRDIVPQAGLVRPGIGPHAGRQQDQVGVQPHLLLLDPDGSRQRVLDIFGQDGQPGINNEGT